MIKSVSITNEITYDVERNVFIHNDTGYLISSDVIMFISFDELSDRMHRITQRWLGIENYKAMKDYINNVETIYI